MVVGITLVQARAIKAALAAGPVTATVGFDGPPEIDVNIYNYASGGLSVTSGVAGLVWSANPACSAAQVRRALEASARQVEGAQGSRNDRYGYGIVQAKAAHDYLQANPCILVEPELIVSAPRPTGGSVVVTAAQVSGLHDTAAERCDGREQGGDRLQQPCRHHQLRQHDRDHGRDWHGARDVPGAAQRARDRHGHGASLVGLCCSDAQHQVLLSEQRRGK